MSEAQYQKIVEICRRSQEILSKRAKEIGDRGPLAESQPYESMWEEYEKHITKPAEFEHADFSGLLFKQARFEHHNFIDCDFSQSRWVFAYIKDSDCSRSRFTGATLLFPFYRTNCTSCDLTNATIHFFNPFEGNNFENANFTNAELNTYHSFFKDKEASSQANFKNAVMKGCRLIIKKEAQSKMTKEELKSILGKIFSPDQLAVMRIKF